MANAHLLEAKTKKRDEFYTQYEDVDEEIKHYKEYLEGKVVYLPCDDPRMSNFWEYFVDNFKFYGLKQLVATYYRQKEDEVVYAYYFDGNKEEKVALEGDGDFRSDECSEILKKCDVVITNPPFSLWRFFLKWIIDADKDCIIISNITVATSKVPMELFMKNKIRLGISHPSEFIVPEEYIEPNKYYKFDKNGKCYLPAPAIWITTFPVGMTEEIKLVRLYRPEEYPKYDNHDAIEVSKVKDIPVDYDGVMGVPITYLFNQSSNFEILGLAQPAAVLNGKEKFKRLFIKRKEE